MNERAPRMSPDDRAASIVDAAIDVIRRTGASPTTKAVAEAAGIAEGTVFRSYPTKEALVAALVGATVCPALSGRAVAAIDPALPLEDRLVQGVRILMRRYEEIHAVVGPLGLTEPPAHHTHPHCPVPDEPTPMHGGPSAIAALLDADADALRFEVSDVVLALRMLAFAGSHTHLTPHRLADPVAIVDLVLDGARWKDSTPGDRAHPPAHRLQPPNHADAATVTASSPSMTSTTQGEPTC
ncbi:MAG: TetR/AcrR family transcriptional regulator [Mobilicoccus sp.]|nr:TetR/AcrR family transcriptional regulator [Mobilicoccus sp.]